MSEAQQIEVLGKYIHFKWINKAFYENNTPVFVLLHQGLGSVAQWGDFPKKLSQVTQCAVLVYDRYGYGKSEALSQPHDADFMHRGAHELHELVHTLKINNRIIVYGHSDGGTIALLYGGLFPEKACGIVAEAPHVLLEDISISGLQEAKIQFESGVLKSRLQKYHHGHTESMFYGWNRTWLEVVPRNWDIFNELSNIIAPTCVIYGTMDEYGTVKQVEHIRSRVKGKSGEMIFEGGGHFPHKEYEQEVLDKMKLFQQSINTHKHK